MIAIAAQQFIRVYDLNMEAKSSSFEFVLPLGDVTELAFSKCVALEFFYMDYCIYEDEKHVVGPFIHLPTHMHVFGTVKLTGDRFRGLITWQF